MGSNRIDTSYLIVKRGIRSPFFWLTLAAVSFVVYWSFFLLPNNLFHDPYATLVLDRNEELLGARISKDGQWRFAPLDSVPSKMEICITQFEDKRFRSHYGVDIKAMARAMKLNISQGKVVSGGSTITMQVIRMSRKNQSRSILEKVTEVLMATRLEVANTKDSILNLYLSNAPFGGNVVGLNAASWKYYGRSPHLLSWSECATLAVLPNSPSLIHPGRNRNKLRQKRDFLLEKLLSKNIIDSTTYQLSILEPLPEKPVRLPNLSPHLTEWVKKENMLTQGKIRTSIDRRTQMRCTQIINNHSFSLAQNGIQNAGAIVVDVKSGQVISYIGNSTYQHDIENGAVDMIHAQRSSGSIFKPFLYAAALDDGLIYPNEIMSDIPTFYHGYRPKNYSHTYDGVIPANQALARSLNIPFARLLSRYGHKKFHAKLRENGITTLNQHADHYGLSLILGGAETKLWDLANTYTQMAQTLHNYDAHGLLKQRYQFSKITVKNQLQEDHNTTEPPFNVSSIWHTFQAMQQLERPGIENSWKNFSSSKRIAWKTGTSFGFRDAWAVGVTTDYVVAVWVGNADGEGRPGLIGAQAAGPILFDIINSLNTGNQWFISPIDEMEKVVLCKNSGMKANSNCADTISSFTPVQCSKRGLCTYCRLEHLDAEKKLRVNSSCYAPSKMTHLSYFQLSPTQEWYFSKKHPSYKKLPPYMVSCGTNSEEHQMQIIYPAPHSKIFLPRDVDGVKNDAIFEVSHKRDDAKIYWHIDNEFLGETTDFHEYLIQPGVGKHRLTVVDDKGESLTVSFEIID